MLRLVLIAVVTAAVLVAVPLAGWTPVLRLSAVLVPALAMIVLAVTPWRWRPDEWDALGRGRHRPE